MITRQTSISLLFSALCLLGIFLAAGNEAAAGEPAIDGWQKGAPYHKLYDPQVYTSFKGTVEDIIDVVPLKGMAPGTGLLVRTSKGQQIQVHLGPKSFVDVTPIGLKKGDKVKVMGVYASADKKRFFIASKVKKGEFVQVKLRRTSDGVPFWVMTMDELAEFTAEFGPPTPEEQARGGPRYFTTEPSTQPTRKRGPEFLNDKIR
ncbi:MAG: hypothetical protein RBS57_14770 [Desulforhabdus sp.]|jgi:hypothetical protein|nr:hypothetical protein [Desulforhabdus sp.]